MTEETNIRLIKSDSTDYIPATFEGKNASGMRVMGKNVLIRVDECSPTSAGGVILPGNKVEAMTMNSTTGVIIAKAPEAFRLFDDGTRWAGDVPEPGDRIWFEKYAGTLQTGRDGATYRIMDYRAIAAVMITEDE